MRAGFHPLCHTSLRNLGCRIFFLIGAVKLSFQISHHFSRVSTSSNVSQTSSCSMSMCQQETFKWNGLPAVHVNSMLSGNRCTPSLAASLFILHPRVTTQKAGLARRVHPDLVWGLHHAKFAALIRNTFPSLYFMR